MQLTLFKLGIFGQLFSTSNVIIVLAYYYTIWVNASVLFAYVWLGGRGWWTLFMILKNQEYDVIYV